MKLFLLVNDYIKKMEVDYALCGGSAIDLFVGHKTRPHKDMYVSVYWKGRNKIIQYMLDDGWDIYEPCGCQYLHKINKIKRTQRSFREVPIIRRSYNLEQS